MAEPAGQFPLLDVAFVPRVVYKGYSSWNEIQGLGLCESGLCKVTGIGFIGLVRDV